MEYALGLVWNLQNKANGRGGEQDRNGVLRECACLSVRERESGGGDMQYKLDCVFFWHCFTSIWAAPPPHEVLAHIVVFSSTAVAL